MSHANLLSYLIMEYVDGGELFHYVDERKGLPEDETVYIFRQIVSALLYCHRLLICHRDLKPENILLNQADLTVKLIDFGMAALQPEGKQLSTPCGSPHYAAPEVVSSKPYDGTKADVWSCGVILYVMLTGTTPFNYSPEGDIRVLFRDIAKADYWMPPTLSKEARDLIRRIFVPEPGRRITMDGVWDHPLLHKYDTRFGFEGRAGTKEAAIGPIPTLTDFKVKRIQDIDREILRNMRTLWHSEPEQGLIQKLLSNDINQEKLFYSALVKHRDENLENYSGPEDMDYSNSDYHHNQAPKHTAFPPVPSIQAPRSQSQYSIMNDEHLRPSQSFVGPPPSMSSYDPYRASRDPIVDVRGEYVNITVHRKGSSGTQRASVRRSLRHQNALRVEVMKQGRRSRSNQSSSSLAQSGHSRSSLRRSSASHHSMNGSIWPSSPPVIAKMRPSELHRRGISFGHVRRSSTTSALVSHSSGQTPPTPSIPDTFRDRRTLRPANPQPLGSSPGAVADSTVRSRKERGAVPQTPRIKVRKAADTPSQHMRNDIRKHSAELEKACEEAFFRSSVGSSLTAHTTFSEKNGPFDTPPSSVSARGSGTMEHDVKPTSRPLPDLPKDTPNTYLTRTLEETREKLAAYRAAGDDNTAKFEEVMKMLETIMPGSRLPDGKRTSSAPETKSADHPRFLPVISEESDRRSSRDTLGNWQRSVTAPVQKGTRSDDKTIRVVQPSSPGTVAPLNVRKRSNGSEGSSEGHRTLSVRTSHGQLSGRQSNAPSNGLEVIDEDTTLTAAPTTIRKKRSGWFGLSKKPADDDKKSNEVVDWSLSEQFDLKKKRSSRVLSKSPPPGVTTAVPPPSAQSSEFPIRKEKARGGRQVLSKWLGRKGGNKQEEAGQAGELVSMKWLDSHADVFTAEPKPANASLDSLFSAASPAPSSDDTPPAAGPGRSWFARFFHIKPAVKILCFSIPRGRARQELIILLREWQRHGIENLEFSRETNTITATVAKQNALDIKPVSFRIELFVVLEHGRRVGLSIARFVQTKGAASGFKRVLEVVDGVMRGRGWLVEDEEKWKALCEVVGG